MGGVDPTSDLLRATRRLQAANAGVQIAQRIQSGGLDGSLDSIEGAIAARRAEIKANLEDRVKEVYGPDAEIVVKHAAKTPTEALCGAELGGVPTCGPASDCPHQPRQLTTVGPHLGPYTFRESSR